jgi:hypothetical protein
MKQGKKSRPLPERESHELIGRTRKPAVRQRRQRMMPLLKRFVWVAVSGLGVFTLLLYPFESRVVPMWSVQVVDESDRPVSGVDVQQEWGQFGPEKMIWADQRVTGLDGRVVFPERVVPAPLGPRALIYFLTIGLEPASGAEKHGPASHLFVCEPGQTGEITWERGRGQPEERMLLHKGFCHYSSVGT